MSLRERNTQPINGYPGASLENTLSRIGIKDKGQILRYLQQLRPPDPDMQNIKYRGLKPPDNRFSDEREDDERNGPPLWFGTRAPESDNVANLMNYIKEMGLEA